MQQAAAGAVGRPGTGGANRLVDSSVHMRPVQDADCLGKVLGGLRLDPLRPIAQHQLFARGIPVQGHRCCASQLAHLVAGAKRGDVAAGRQPLPAALAYRHAPSRNHPHFAFHAPHLLPTGYPAPIQADQQAGGGSGREARLRLRLRLLPLLAHRLGRGLQPVVRLGLLHLDFLQARLGRVVTHLLGTDLGTTELVEHAGGRRIGPTRSRQRARRR
jgi:hypothetical protein